MRESPDISLARFLMILSMILLGILEYLWLHNEYAKRYSDMEDKLNHVMFSSVRDLEDSLLFTKLADTPLKPTDKDQRPVAIVIHTDDTASFQKDGVIE